jgi:hypothetical protein
MTGWACGHRWPHNAAQECPYCADGVEVEDYWELQKALREGRRHRAPFVPWLPVEQYGRIDWSDVPAVAVVLDLTECSGWQRLAEHGRRDDE